MSIETQKPNQKHKDRIRKWNLEEYLPRIAAPIQMIQGRDDEYGTEKQLQAIVTGVKGRCETVLLDRCGHSPHKEQPQATLAAMTDFVRRL